MKTQELKNRILENQETLYFENGKDKATVWFSYVRKSLRIMLNDKTLDHDRNLDNLNTWLRIRKFKLVDITK
jgi:hypothetical protein